MELTGSTADRWEQMSNKINEIALSISAKQELIKGISSTIEDLNAELDAEHEILEQLSNLALKEVLREESGTLNDEAPVFEDAQNPEKKTEKLKDTSDSKKFSEEQKKTDKNNTKSPEKPAKQTELFHDPEE